MSDESRNTHSSAGMITAMIVLPLLYLLSIGPFVWAIGHGYIGAKSARLMMETFYKPVQWLIHTPLRDFLTAYVNWWDPPMPTF